MALPLARPVVALVAFFSFVGNWNNFFLPLVLPSSNQSRSRSGSTTCSPRPRRSTRSRAGLDITSPELALTTIISIAPMLVVFLFSQRALVSGMLAGATKG